MKLQLVATRVRVPEPHDLHGVRDVSMQAWLRCTTFVGMCTVELVVPISIFFETHACASIAIDVHVHVSAVSAVALQVLEDEAAR